MSEFWLEKVGSLKLGVRNCNAGILASKNGIFKNQECGTAMPEFWLEKVGSLKLGMRNCNAGILARKSGIFKNQECGTAMPEFWLEKVGSLKTRSGELQCRNSGQKKWYL